MSNTIPYVFISSTVAEFRDLRSAIAYTLRAQGYNVYLSEAADFDVKGDRSAFEECFTNICNSDFYILIIGSTRGSIFTEDISITRQEYRIAREAFLSQGRPRLLMYIRETTEIALNGNKHDWEKGGIDDTEHLRSFINEVKSPGIEGAPNFLGKFRDFEDLMTALAISMNLGRDFSEKLIRHSLLSELLSNLTHMVGGKNTVLFPTHWYMTSVRKGIEITHDDIYKEFNITDDQSIRLGMSLVTRMKGANLQTRCMEDAIDKGVFLAFNPATILLEETPIHELLNQTAVDINNLRKHDIQTDWADTVVKAIYEFRHKHTTSLKIRGIDLTFAFAYYDTTEDIFQEHLALCKYLLGVSDVLPQYERSPLTPLGKEMEERLREEQVSGAQISALIQKNIQPFGEKYSSMHFGENRQETVKKLAEILRSGEEKRGVDMSLFEGAKDLFERIADSLVSD